VLLEGHELVGARGRQQPLRVEALEFRLGVEEGLHSVYAFEGKGDGVPPQGFGRVADDLGCACCWSVCWGHCAIGSDPLEQQRGVEDDDGARGEDEGRGHVGDFAGGDDLVSYEQQQIHAHIHARHKLCPAAHLRLGDFCLGDLDHLAESRGFRGDGCGPA
jgi:hypothetical protein